MAGNTFGSGTESYGGGYAVWRLKNALEQVGGLLSALPAVGSILPEGSLVSVSAGVATALNTFELAEAITALSTSVKVNSIGKMPRLNATMNVMVAPATVETTGTGVLVGTVTDNEDGTQSFTITANALGALDAGAILVEASKAGSGSVIACVPTGLTSRDVNIVSGNTKASIGSVYNGEIFEALIQPIPACVKAKLTQIKFS